MARATMAPRPLKEVQTGLDEKQIDDPNILGALRSREEARIEASEMRRQYNDADEKAKSLIAGLDLEDGDVARVGEFRIERKVTKPRSVSFETEAKTRISITKAEE